MPPQPSVCAKQNIKVLSLYWRYNRQELPALATIPFVVWYHPAGKLHFWTLVDHHAFVAEPSCRRAD